MKIIWKEEHLSYGDTTNDGYVGNFGKPLFSCYYNCVNKDNKERPYILTNELQLKAFRFKSIEECKQKAEELLEYFVKSITEGETK